MEEIVLGVQLREEAGRGKVKHLRDKGFVPAVVYSQGQDALSVKISTHDLVRLVHQYRLESMVINLKIDDKKHKPKPCLIKEIQYDPVKGNIVHVDFNEISLTKVIKVAVPVEAKGEAAGVKQEGGSLEHILWEIEVECLPTNIPKKIEVDISPLKIGDSIHVKDLSLPADVKVLADPSAIVLSVAAPMKEEVAAPPVEGEEKQEPEVIKEKKEVPGEAVPEEGKEKKEK